MPSTPITLAIHPGSLITRNMALRPRRRTANSTRAATGQRYDHQGCKIALETLQEVHHRKESIKEIAGESTRMLTIRFMMEKSIPRQPNRVKSTPAMAPVFAWVSGTGIPIWDIPSTRLAEVRFTVMPVALDNRVILRPLVSSTRQPSVMSPTPGKIPPSARPMVLDKTPTPTSSPTEFAVLLAPAANVVKQPPPMSSKVSARPATRPLGFCRAPLRTPLKARPNTFISAPARIKAIIGKSIQLRTISPTVSA